MQMADLVVQEGYYDVGYRYGYKYRYIMKWATGTGIGTGIFMMQASGAGIVTGKL